MGNIVIVGGGIVGLFASIYLKNSDNNVILIEQSTRLGGLVSSYTNKDGIKFDYGTHIPMKTGNKEIDEILFKGMTEEHWENFINLEPANYFEGKMNINSVYPDVRYLDEKTYQKGLIELLSTESSNLSNINLLLYLKEIYGEVFALKVYKPIMEKLIGIDIDKMTPAIFQLFDIRRLIVGNDHLTSELKHSKIYDSKIAYNNYSKGGTSIQKYYAKHNAGVGLWVNNLKIMAEDLGVEIYTSESIKRIEVEEGKIVNILTESGLNIETDRVVWTISSEILSKTLNMEINLPKLNFNSTVLFHFNFDRDFLIDNHYVMCLDKTLKTFRVTLYPNLTSTLKEQGIYNCTVEVFLKDGCDISKDEILNELIQMGIIGEKAQVLSDDRLNILNSFPIIDSNFIDALNIQREHLEYEIKNIELLGKSSGKYFFMNDLILQAYDVLNR